MTIDEAERALPNGFHDAFLGSVSIDYVRRTVQLEIEVWVGSMSAPHYEGREAYRRVRLSFSGLLLFAVDVPNAEYLNVRAKNGLRIEKMPPGSGGVDKNVWPDEALPEGAFRFSFYFTDECSSYLHIAAENVRMDWLSDARTIYGGDNAP